MGELIGRGGQFKVYEAGPNRVLKVPNSDEEALAMHSGWASTAEEAAESARQGLAFRDSNVPRILRMVSRYSALDSLLGHPKAESDGCFSQDKVRMLGDQIADSEPGEITNCFKKYASCIHNG